MGTISSAEFRKVYGKLREPTVVTVNGHVMGTWTPVDSAQRLPGAVLTEVRAINADAPGFNTSPFTPVPKHGKR